jgi:hypothetical protein
MWAGFEATPLLGVTSRTELETRDACPDKTNSRSRTATKSKEGPVYAFGVSFRYSTASLTRPCAASISAYSKYLS